MKRVLVVVLLAAGCQAPETLPIAPLPENGQPIPFGEILQRARVQAGAATEAFYENNWAGLEHAALGIEQSGRLLARASQVPDRHQGKLGEISIEVVQEADQLRQAAKAQDVKLTAASLQRINLKVRELRP
jgi:hypothetical protein